MLRLSDSLKKVAPAAVTKKTLQRAWSVVEAEMEGLRMDVGGRLFGVRPKDFTRSKIQVSGGLGKTGSCSWLRGLAPGVIVARNWLRLSSPPGT